jgi:uroporphyrin-III C-methyltransferase/precorrin-2 dehydrogenase/sirohydrochlorin ferrochelatase
MSGDGPVVPVGLRVSGRRVVVVGGGPVGLRRVSSLLEAGADVVLVSPEVVTALADLADRGRLQWHRRGYEPGDLDGAWLSVACTADPDVNAAVLTEAETRRVWCLRADDARTASAWMPATGRTGPATVAVHADRDPRQAAALRDTALAAVEEALRAGTAPRSRPGAAPRGRVVLVGGGPGDAGLLTVRGAERLAEADVVVVDRLAPLSVLDGLAPEVEVVDVGKIPRGRFTPQQSIDALLVEHALAGRTVVRLKGGDPFVFGRGREEVEACLAAGVPVEVVPGVSSAVAVPELAGVPVTHRGLSQGFTVVSGHAAPGDPRSQVDWSALARSGTTLVLLMAVDTLPAIADALLAGGLERRTPVCCVQDGGLATQRVLRSTLGEVAPAALEFRLRAPAVTVVGEVAALASGRSDEAAGTWSVP